MLDKVMAPIREQQQQKRLLHQPAALSTEPGSRAPAAQIERSSSTDSSAASTPTPPRTPTSRGTIIMHAQDSVSLFSVVSVLTNALCYS